MIASGVASFVEDFVIRCYQVTKLFCSWNRSLIASSARNPRNFGSQAHVAISVSREVSVNTVLPFLCLHFWSITFRIWEHSFRGCAGTCVSRSSRFSEKGCNQSGMPCVGSSSFISSSVCAELRFSEACLSRVVCIRFPHACLTLRVVIGSDDISAIGLDVEAEQLLEDDDNPGTLCLLVSLHFSVCGHQRRRGPGPPQSVHFIWAYSACALKLPNQPQKYVLLCFWRLARVPLFPQENRT